MNIKEHILAALGYQFNSCEKLLAPTNLIRTAICLALLLIQFATPAPVKACSCGGPGSPADAFLDFDAVFTGKVTRITAKSSPANSVLNSVLVRLKLRPIFYSNFVWGYEVTFRVSKSWKNVSTTNVTIHTGGGGGDCGYSFTRSNDSLVYAHKRNNNGTSDLEAIICSRTIGISGATEDLSYLNTLPTLPLTPVYDYSWIYFAGAVLFLIVLLFIVIVLFQRRQQRQRAGDNP